MEEQHSPTTPPKRFKRVFSAIIVGLAIIAGLYIGDVEQRKNAEAPPTTSGSEVSGVQSDITSKYKSAIDGLNALPVKGRAPKTGYSRSQFGDGWAKSGGCDTRNQILARDLKDVTYEMNSCLVSTGTLQDPYTGKSIQFIRGSQTSSLVQIDHVVALSDAWQKGAQLLTPLLREQLANDSLELLAVDGPANQNKGDGDAATWLPSNKSFRCTYVARQVSVKLKYSLWVTAAEKNAISNILEQCPNEPLVS